MATEEYIKPKALESLEKMRSYLQEDGGDVEYVRFEEDTSVLEIRLLGNCKGCPLSIMTLRAGLERILIDDIPEIKRVEAVN